MSIGGVYDGCYDFIVLGNHSAKVTCIWEWEGARPEGTESAGGGQGTGCCTWKAWKGQMVLATTHIPQSETHPISTALLTRYKYFPHRGHPHIRSQFILLFLFLQNDILVTPYLCVTLLIDSRPLEYCILETSLSVCYLICSFNTIKFGCVYFFSFLFLKIFLVFVKDCEKYRNWKQPYWVSFPYPSAVFRMALCSHNSESPKEVGM